MVIFGGDFVSDFLPIVRDDSSFLRGAAISAKTCYFWPAVCKTNVLVQNIRISRREAFIGEFDWFNEFLLVVGNGDVSVLMLS